MSDFQVNAIPEEVLAQARAIAAGGTDPAYELHTDRADYPLRCCLRLSTAADRLMLFPYSPPGLTGPWREVGPVYAHAEPCGGLTERDRLPEELAGGCVLRGYDKDGQMYVHELDSGEDTEAAVIRILADPNVAHLHRRAVTAGCFTFDITRA